MNQQNFGRSTGVSYKLKFEEVIEGYKFKLANGILLGAAILLVASGLLWVFKEIPGKEIYKSATTILHPIILLVIGYYFGQKKE